MGLFVFLAHYGAWGVQRLTKKGKLVFLGDAQKESLGMQTKHWTLGVEYSKLILIYDKQRCRMG